MPGWGQGQWGLSTWGLGGLEALYLTAAYATSVRSVRVELSRPPRSGNPSQPGDAGNPSSWTIRRGTAGAFLTVLGATLVGPQTVEVYVLETFPAYPDVLTVAAVGLRDSLGALTATPSSLLFHGVTPASAIVAAGQRDFYNPPYDTQSQVGGTMRVTSAGDYALHGGSDLLRKLVIRRLTTARGSFAHLPNYGMGLQTKEPLVIQDLSKLRAEIRRQLSFEPEITTADVRLTLNAVEGLLIVSVTAVLANTTQPVTATIDVPTGSL